MSSRAEKERKVNDALWQFGDEVKRTKFDPDHDDDTKGVVLPPEAAAKALAAIMAVFE